MSQMEKYSTAPSKEKTLTVRTNNVLRNKRNIPGNSVNQHYELEEANALIAEDEIGQQNENL